MNKLLNRYDSINMDAISCFDFEQAYIIKNTFLGDAEKMNDFKILTKDEFLKSYSYISEIEYDQTRDYLSSMINIDFKSWNSLRDFIESKENVHIDITTHIDFLVSRAKKLLKADFEAKTELARVNDARFWRIYYMVQEILSKHLIHLYQDNSDGGIRQQSTLPPKLNKDAMEIAKEVYTNCRFIKKGTR